MKGQPSVNFFEVIQVGAAVLGALGSVVAQLSAGQPASLPPVRTYIGGRHVELDVKVTPLT
ncbi:MAG: hypothetical protein ACREP1_11835 [Rhodanobacteraceae bacterium]